MAYDCGVYRIENLANGNRYIGSACSIKKRWKEHRRQLESGKHHSQYLQRAWNKYGADAFEFKPLIYCDRSDLISFEQAAMDAYEPEYNIAPVAGSQLGYRHSDQTRKKMSIARRRNPSSPRKGMTHTDEAKRRISEKKRGVKQAPETVKKRAAALKARMGNTKICRFNKNQILDIRARCASGESNISISRVYRVSNSVISEIKTRRAYRWVL